MNLSQNQNEVHVVKMQIGADVCKWGVFFTGNYIL